MSVPILK